MKSEAIPEKNDETVKVVVGLTMNKMIFENDNDALIMVHAEWCGHCKDFMPKFKDLAGKLKDYNKLIFATVNGPENELEGISFASYPTIVFVQKGDKKPRIIYFN